MTYEAKTVDEYISSIPADRQAVLQKLRETVNQNIPKDFMECMSYGIPSWSVPHSLYPAGYHCKPDEPLPFLSIGSQKNYIAFYHGGVYALPELSKWFSEEWAKLNIGKLDMGKSCIRLKKMDKIPYELLGELMKKISVNEWIEIYERRNSK